MTTNQLQTNSLILYKNRPGRIVTVGKKLEIELDDGRTLSVRPKDVTLLHPGPCASLNQLTPPEGDVETAWELLAGETTTLAELAELAYGEYTPATAWAAWELVTDGLYFSGTPDVIEGHTAAAVQKKQAGRAAKAAEEQAWQDFAGRLEENRYDAEADGRYLQEIAAVALGQQEKSRVLRQLKQAETPENAHALLLRIGYWAETVNPYPIRLGINLDPPAMSLPPLPDEPRRDLTHLAAWAIDDEGNVDPDDAISWDDGRIWIHIADAAALIPPDSAADREARGRGASLYLPEQTIPMLPAAATQTLGLGLNDVSPALSIGIDLTPEGEIAHVEITTSWLRVSRLSYAAAEERLAEPAFRDLYTVAQAHESQRHRNGAVAIDLPEVKVRVEEGEVVIRPLPPLRSRDLVREMMLLAGTAVAQFAIEHDIPLPFTTQEAPDMPPDLPDTPSGMFARRRAMSRSQQGSIPGPHAGLGLPHYVQCTSPLRRYLDMVTHQQLRLYLRGAPLLDAQAIMERVGAANAITGEMRLAERLSNQHWKLVYLLRHPDWQGEGVIVDKRGKRDVALLPELALETSIYAKGKRPLDATLTLQFQEANLPELETHFSVIRDA
ncbi:MAG TPA: RNB domain-containing ribonuclease [Anaerolineae bacterium]|nr:RNB domain-containing ribonuclease [Anaerolineae bacterium]HIP69762.1 RNB domain-containing ribonuclease [Anaerolineae bacterium]